MASNHCGHCGDAASQRCGDCQIVHYCSKECQIADRPWHKLLCKQTAEFADKPKSDQELRRVILLPERGLKPVFYWMPMHVEEGYEDDEDEDDIEFASDIGVPDRDAKSGSIMPADDDGCGVGDAMPQFISLIVGKMGNGEHLNHTIKMMCKDYFFDYPPNPCLARLLGNEVAYNFRGPLIFLRMTKVEDSCFTLDIDASDFTLALDGLAEYAKKQANSLDYFMNGGPQPKKVSGVNINADVPYYEEVKVLRSNKIFTAGGTLSLLARKIGLPLLTNMVWEKTEVSATSEFVEEAPALPAAYLHLSVDASSPDFGTIPATLKNNTASTLVVSADKITISVSMVITLCDFIKDIAQPILAKASKSSTKDRQAAVDSVIELWKQRSAADNSDSDEESSDDDDEDGGFVDAGDFDDLADARAKMGQMQMATTDARSGMGYI